jgi:RimJ/RimL family protein N-acetyltransferase
MMEPQQEFTMQIGRLSLVPACARDEAFWLTLRNDPEAVKWSRHPKPITPEAHHVWFQESLHHPARRLYLATLLPSMMADAQPIAVGYGRLDRGATHTELSIVVAANWRTRAIGPKIILMLLYAARELHWPSVKAIVHGRNRRSLRLFLRSGFVVKQHRWIEFRFESPRVRPQERTA